MIAIYRNENYSQILTKKINEASRSKEKKKLTYIVFLKKVPSAATLRTSE